MNGLLVVVSCGSTKVWGKKPHLGSVAAKDAYSSPIFRTSRRYAEHFAERWVILSAKYGFIEPEALIPANYNVSFYDDDSVKSAVLKQQVQDQGLGRLKTVGVLGSEIYWRQVQSAFADSSVVLRHINGNVGFAPLFQTLIGRLVTSNTPFVESAE